QKAEYAKKAICALDGYELFFTGPTFNEFAIETPLSADVVREALLEEQIIGGLPLETSYPEFADALLLCVTEQHSKKQIDRLVSLLKHIKLESELV
ncbi:MAG: glycine dehydrogenase, partial [bacterium]|nr:glycine dehydrogenase [bacterium]